MAERSRSGMIVDSLGPSDSLAELRSRTMCSRSVRIAAALTCLWHRWMNTSSVQDFATIFEPAVLAAFDLNQFAVASTTASIRTDPRRFPKTPFVIPMASHPPDALRSSPSFTSIISGGVMASRNPNSALDLCCSSQPSTRLFWLHHVTSKCDPFFQRCLRFPSVRLYSQAALRRV